MGDKNRFNCTSCDKKFKTNFGLERHAKEVHGIKLEKRRYVSKYKCPLCDIISKDYEQYREHVLQSHKIKVEVYFYKFKTQTHFLAWKRKVEKETKSFYVRETKIYSKDKKRVLEETKPCITKIAGVIHYSCHRSGFLRVCKDESERKRRFKAQGTVKINAYCPAKISAEFKRKGTVKVVYCPTHVGHECEVSYLRLTEDERREIAAKIAAKIPFDVILDEIRNTAGSSNISKMHLLTKRDLWTISHSSYFKKYSQSVESSMPSKKEQSNLEASSGKDLPQDLFTNTNTDYVKEFEDTELLTFDPNDPESDSDLSSDCSEFGNIQPQKEVKVGHRLTSVVQPMRTNKSTPLQQDISIYSCKKLDEFCISKKQSMISHSPHFDKYSQSIEPSLASIEVKSNSEPTSSADLSQDLFSSTQSDDLDFEETDILTFDLDVDSNSSSDCAKVGNIRPEELKVIHRPSSLIKHQQPKTKSSPFQRNQPISTPCKKMNGFLISERQNQLVEKFRSNVSNLTSSKEIKWVEHHINRMFILLKSMKERNQCGTKDALLVHKGKNQQNFSSVSNQQHLELRPLNKSELKDTLATHSVKDPQISNIDKNQLFPEIMPSSERPKKSIVVSSRPRLDFQSRLVKCSPILSTDQKKSIYHSRQPIVGDKKNLKPDSPSKTQSLSSEKIKQYLLPIAGKPGKYLIVQKNINEPPQLTPVTPEPELCNKNAVNVDHSYSL